jgi:sugar phosphate isomerase/epimerase
MTYIQDIERQEPAEYASLLRECEELCIIAKSVGCPMVQLLTGPLVPSGPYQGLTGRPWPEMRKLTAKNLKALSDIGHAHGIRFFLEALTWTPLHKLEHALELLDETGRDNVGIVVDFWHLWDSGATADQVAKLNKDIIFCTHFCDSLEPWGVRGTYEQRGRDIWTGAGNIPLKEWVDAVLATGFDGAWSCELLAPKYWELDPFNTARDLKNFLEYMFV